MGSEWSDVCSMVCICVCMGEMVIVWERGENEKIHVCGWEKRKENERWKRETKMGRERGIVSERTRKKEADYHCKTWKPFEPGARIED